MQAAPRIANAMSQILHKVHRDVEGAWVGSSVVHLGDQYVDVELRAACVRWLMVVLCFPPQQRPQRFELH